jgi:hypothetical protein
VVTKRKSRLKANLLEVYAFGPIVFASDDSNARIVITVKIPPQSNMINRILSGKSRELSPEIRIKQWECSICHGDYEKCSHKNGFLYDDIKCQVIAKDIEFRGGSIVDEAKDPRCRVTDLLLVGRINKRQKCFEWHGFEVNSESDRFKSIQAAVKQNLIPEEAAFRFSEFFSVSLFGKCQYI